MNEQPNIGIPSNAKGESPTRDPALADIQTALTQTISPTGDTISPNSTRSDSGPPGVMPDLSIATGSSASGKQAAPEPPKLDGYNVVIPIGEGGMGTVWRAVQLSTRRNVALKLISAAGFASGRARQRFDREVEITARLEHPNIARVYDSGINRGVYFYAMELIDGVPLDQYVSRHHLSRPDILRLFTIVCRAVDHAHQRGVIHRDLKPGNILVSPDGQPHVLDFGLAKALQQAGKEAGISIDGEVAGTPGYMSPEQAAGKIDLDARCDVYSLGVILYRLLTGQTPHDLSGTYLDILRRVSEEEPKRPRAADRTMDRELEALLLRALQRDPSHRYKTAGELAQDVASYVAGDPITAKPPTLTYFLRKRARKHRVKIVTAATVAILLGLATLLTFRLVRAHHDAIIEAKYLELQKQGKIQANVQAGIAVGNKLVSDGDAAVVAAKWAEARAAYLSAEAAFKIVVAPTLRADLGLWNLERLDPSALITIPPVGKTGSASPPAITCMALRPDNPIAVIGYDDGSLRQFYMPTGELLRPIRGRGPAQGGTIMAEKGPVRSVAVDRFHLITGGDGGSLNLWDTSGRPIAVLQNPSAPLKNRVTHVALSPDRRYGLSVSGASPELLASENYNDTLTLWDLKSRKPLLTSDLSAKILDVKQTVTSASFSENFKWVVTAGARVSVWNPVDGKEIASIPASAMCANVSPNRRFVFAGSSDGKIRVLSLDGNQYSVRCELGTAIQNIAGDFWSGHIRTIGEDGSLTEIDNNGREVWAHPPLGDIDASAITPDWSLALTANNSVLSVWRFSSAPEVRDIASDFTFPGVSISGDGRLILARCVLKPYTFKSAIFDSATGINVIPEGLTAQDCYGSAMSRDGRTIALLNNAQAVAWSLDPPHEIWKISTSEPRSGDKVTVIAISPDGKRVALSAADHSITVYGIDGASPGRKLTGHTGAITSLAFSDDGRLLLAGSQDRSARLFNVDTGGTMTVFVGHRAPVNCVALSSDGKWAVTAGGATQFETAGDEPDNSIRVWETASGKRLLLLLGPSKRVNAIAISGDGRMIASGSDDAGVILWDRATGDALQTVHGLHGPVLSLAFDQAGQNLVVGTDTGLSIWNLQAPALRRDLEPSMAAIRSKAITSLVPPSDYPILARWYVLQDEPRWAASLLDEATQAGVAVPPLIRMQCHWEAGDLAAAQELIKVIPAQDAPAFYVKLCEHAMLAGRQGH